MSKGQSFRKRKKLLNLEFSLQIAETFRILLEILRYYRTSFPNSPSFLPCFTLLKAALSPLPPFSAHHELALAVSVEVPDLGIVLPERPMQKIAIFPGFFTCLALEYLETSSCFQV